MVVPLLCNYTVGSEPVSGWGIDKLRQRPYALCRFSVRLSGVSKQVNETCKGHTDAATVFIYTLRDTGNLRLWCIKKISFLRHGYHLRSYSYSYSFIFQIHWVKFKDCSSNNPACAALTPEQTVRCESNISCLAALKSCSRNLHLLY